MLGGGGDLYIFYAIVIFWEGVSWEVVNSPPKKKKNYLFFFGKVKEKR